MLVNVKTATEYMDDDVKKKYLQHTLHLKQNTHYQFGKAYRFAPGGTLMDNKNCNQNKGTKIQGEVSNHKISQKRTDKRLHDYTH